MLDGRSDGVAPKPSQAVETLTRIQRLAAERPTIYLPSNDPQSATRLAAARPHQCRRARLRYERLRDRRPHRRTIDDVFAYVSDPLNMPRWYSAVRTVRSLSGAEPHVGSRYLMQRQLPRGAACNQLEIVTREPPTQLTIRTTSGRTPLIYRYRFSPGAGGTGSSCLRRLVTAGARRLRAVQGPVLQPSLEVAHRVPSTPGTPARGRAPRGIGSPETAAKPDDVAAPLSTPAKPLQRPTWTLLSAQLGP
jgi:hypothetical protein